MSKTQQQGSQTPKPRSTPVRADLHIHTTASDGRWLPHQVVEGCLAEGIGLLAVADHDASDSVLATEALALEAGLAFLRGVEISSMAGDTMLHILGYGIDPSDPVLHGVLFENRIKIEAVDDDDIRGLIDLGYDIDYQAYLAYDYDRTRGGFKSLNFCIDRGFCRDAHDFFDNIRSQLNHRWPDFVLPREAISAIRGAGGIPVLAHPAASLKGHGGLNDRSLAPLLDAGIGGLECYSQYHDAATTAYCVDWCLQHDLVITGGSDYHGGYVGRALGVPVVDTSQLRLGPLEDAIRRA
jgi:predicted metal-dependent phosphoesterase TrpH